MGWPLKEGKRKIVFFVKKIIKGHHLRAKDTPSLNMVLWMTFLWQWLKTRSLYEQFSQSAKVKEAQKVQSNKFSCCICQSNVDVLIVQVWWSPTALWINSAWGLVLHNHPREKIADWKQFCFKIAQRCWRKLSKGDNSPQPHCLSYNPEAPPLLVKGC